MLVAICYIVFILNLFLNCSSFLSSFSLSVFIKFFLIQKSKSGTNLNHNEGKQEEALIYLRYYNFCLLRKKISCVIYHWDNVPMGGTVFLGGNMKTANLVKGNFPRVNFPGGQLSLGTIVQGAIIQVTTFLRGNYPWGQLSRRQLSEGGNFSLRKLSAFFPQCYKPQ